MSLTPVPVGDDILVNTLTESAQNSSAVAALDGGGFVVIWTSWFEDGDRWGIYGQRYDATGMPVGEEFRVNTEAAGDQVEPAVVGLADGGFVVAWTSLAEDATFRDIVARRYDEMGEAVGDEFPISPDMQTDNRDPSVTALAGGGFVVAWVGQDDDGSGIYAQRYDEMGEAVGEAFPINSEMQSDQTEPSVAALAGGFVVTWTSEGQDGDFGGIYGQRYDAEGEAVGEEFPVNTVTEGHQLRSAVTALAGGSFVVTWESIDQDNEDRNIYGQLYDESGMPVGDEFQVNTETENSQNLSSVTALADGGFLVAWNSFGQDGSGFGIYGQRYDAAGVPLGEEFKLNQITEGDQFNNSGSNWLATLSNGRVVATWSGPELPEEVFARLIDVPNAPTDISLTGGSAAEFAAAATVVGSLAATDPNIEDTFTFTLLDNAGGRFAIVGNQLQVANGLLLDFEQATSHTITVRVTDGEGLTFDKSFTIAVTDINPETVTGDEAANTFFGGALDDHLSGQGGDDVLFGQGGDDTLVGGAGADLLKGGIGNDKYVLADGNDKFAELAGSGGDLADPGGVDTAVSSVSLELAGHGFIENVALIGTAAINATGNALANVISANDAANVLFGQGGDDWLLGKNGSDTLVGEGGDDRLDGGDGFDRLAGGLGQDKMIGGAQRDIFDFNLVAEMGKTAATRDVILDFSHAEGDAIDLSTIDTRIGVAGDQGFAFIAQAAFSGVQGELRYRFEGSARTIVEGDIDGDKKADFQIELTGQKALTGGDFVL